MKKTDIDQLRVNWREGHEVFGLIGYPLGHSFSRSFFNDKFAREGIDAEYVNFELPDVATLPALIASHPNLRGLNVTIPHKQAVIPYLNDLDDEARAIGAVNVIRIGQLDNLQLDNCDEGARNLSNCKLSNCDEGARNLSNCKLSNCPILKGFNTDVIGFRDSLRPLLRPHHRNALVLGTGGASKAVCRALDTLGISWRYVSRKGGTFLYSDLTPAIIAEHTLIVNCTPLGMSPKVDACPDIPYDALTPRHLLFDLVYNPEETLFLRRGRERGAATKNGLEMLHLQALAAWRIWSKRGEQSTHNNS